MVPPFSSQPLSEKGERTGKSKRIPRGVAAFLWLALGEHQLAVAKGLRGVFNEGEQKSPLFVAFVLFVLAARSTAQP